MQNKVFAAQEELFLEFKTPFIVREQDDERRVNILQIRAKSLRNLPPPANFVSKRKC